MYKHIFAIVPQVASTWRDTLKQLAQQMLKDGYVKESFEEALIAREAEYPTGLGTEPVGVAIPHADQCHVKQSALGIGILQKPVSFGKMGEPLGETVDVGIVFLLAVDRPEVQAPAVAGLIQMLQDSAVIQALALSKSDREAVAIVRERLLSIKSA